MTSNDNIPEDEMMLAETLAAVNDRGLGWCAGSCFQVGRVMLDPANRDRADRCCALGAMVIAGVIDEMETHYSTRREGLLDVTYGNDDWDWSPHDDDRGESLGHAFRCAMTQDEP